MELPFVSPHQKFNQVTDNSSEVPYGQIRHSGRDRLSLRNPENFNDLTWCLVPRLRGDVVGITARPL